MTLPMPICVTNGFFLHTAHHMSEQAMVLVRDNAPIPAGVELGAIAQRANVVYGDCVCVDRAERV